MSIIATVWTAELDMGGNLEIWKKGEVAGFKMQGLALFFPVRKVDLVTGGVMWNCGWMENACRLDST